MQETIISQETFKLARSKGCILERCICGGFPECICTDKRVTQGLLQKWLREERNIHILIDFGDLSEKFYVEVYNMRSLRLKYSSDVIFETYEEALEKGLQEGLRLIN